VLGRVGKDVEVEEMPGRAFQYALEQAVQGPRGHALSAHDVLNGQCLAVLAPLIPPSPREIQTMDNLEVSGPTAPPPARDPSPKRPAKQKVRKPKAPVADADAEGGDAAPETPGSLDVLT